jgi:hypothetical protein
MCNVCADNAAAFDVKMPNSRCAKLVLQALVVTATDVASFESLVHDCRRVFAPVPAGHTRIIASSFHQGPRVDQAGSATSPKTRVMFVGVATRAPGLEPDIADQDLERSVAGRLFFMTGCRPAPRVVAPRPPAMPIVAKNADQKPFPRLV